MYTDTWEKSAPDISALLAFQPLDEIAYNMYMEVYEDTYTAAILQALRRRRPAPDTARTA